MRYKIHSSDRFVVSRAHATRRQNQSCVFQRDTLRGTIDNIESNTHWEYSCFFVLHRKQRHGESVGGNKSERAEGVTRSNGTLPLPPPHAPVGERVTLYDPITTGGGGGVLLNKKVLCVWRFNGPTKCSNNCLAANHEPTL